MTTSSTTRPARRPSGPDGRAASLTPSAASRPPRPRRRRHLGIWWMVAVPGVITLGMLIYPLASNIWTSLHIDRLSVDDGTFVGLDNYRDLFRFGDLGQTLQTTLVWTFGCLIFQAIIGFVAALVLDGMGKISGPIRAFLLMPWVMPGVVISAVWLAILNPINGLANTMLGYLGIAPHDWLGDPATALASLIFVNVWKGFPFWMLMISAGLKAIPHELHEAAALDGAGYFRRVRYVILPSLRPVIVLTALLAFIWTFNYFDLAYAMTNGGPNGATTTLAFDIYETSFVFNRFDQGSALSVVSFAFMSIAIGFYIWATRRSNKEVF